MDNGSSSKDKRQAVFILSAKLRSLVERGGQEVTLGTIKRSIDFSQQKDACSEKKERGFFCFGSLRQDVLLSMRDVCSSMRGWRVRERGGEDVLAPLCERCLLIKREGWRMCEVTVAKIGWELPLFLSLCSQLPHSSALAERTC